jgi:GrpB-like predicted nucleotidyltransferase (UPF0157 family)
LSRQVLLVPYDPAWPRRFEDERAALQESIGLWATRIEHMGSTSVPGLAAKPIIDIMVGLRSLDDAGECIPRVVALGYEYVPEFENEMPYRRFFRRDSTGHEDEDWQPTARSAHIHMVELTHWFFRDHLLFRDYLRAHPESARAYEALKHRLALEHAGDREAYADAKSDFVQAALAAARVWEESAGSQSAAERRLQP